MKFAGASINIVPTKSPDVREDYHRHLSTCSRANDMSLRNPKKKNYLTQEKMNLKSHIRVALQASKGSKTMVEL